MGGPLLVSTGVAASQVEVVNPDASFPEGPLWHGGQLYYVEYGADTVMRWDGKENAQVWWQFPGHLLRRQRAGQDHL